MDTLYLVSGCFTSLAGIAMMTVYSVTSAWWRSYTGRMLMTYAVAETGMSAIFASAVYFHISPHWFRAVWVGLQATVGVVLWYQTAMILKLNRQKKEGPA